MYLLRDSMGRFSPGSKVTRAGRLFPQSFLLPVLNFLLQFWHGKTIFECQWLIGVWICGTVQQMLHQWISIHHHIAAWQFDGVLHQCTHQSTFKFFRHISQPEQKRKKKRKKKGINFSIQHILSSTHCSGCRSETYNSSSDTCDCTSVLTAATNCVHVE